MTTKQSRAARKRWASMSTRKYNAVCANMSKGQRKRRRRS